MKKPVFTLWILIVPLMLFFACNRQNTTEVSLDQGWVFNPGDDRSWAAADYADQDWTHIDVSRPWELQGFQDLNGYAWYRIRFYLPSDIRKQYFFKDTLLIEPGKIDDADQVFLNGQLLGQANRSFPSGTVPDTGITRLPYLWDTPRTYKVSCNDPRIRWDAENVLAVRVWDQGGAGGIRAKHPRIRMRDIQDYLVLDIQRDPFRIQDRVSYTKTIYLVNKHPEQDFRGILEITATDNVTNRVVYSKKIPVTVPHNDQVPEEISFALDQPQSTAFLCRFTPEKNGASINAETVVPYLLTPPLPDAARIHTPAVYGARPGHPFLYRIPVTGVRPFTIVAENLPEGLVFNQDEQVIRGITPPAGDYPVRIIAKNEQGADTSTLVIKAGKDIALTPPLGWNSWNVWGLSVDDAKVRAAADAFVETGLADHGWSYINIDDGWEAPERQPDGSITGNEKFPDFKTLADYVHSKGLKLGIYSGPGPQTCGGFLASYQHEYQDAQTWASWGIDYLKYDWCSYNRIAKDHSLAELQKPYLLMRKALDAVNRDIVYSLCQYGMGEVWKWGAKVGGNLWRTTGDIRDTWESMSGIGFRQDEMSPYASPGHWNDPDMLVVGWVGWGPSLHQTQLTPDEQYTHISLWALLSAPLLIGCDLTRLDDFTLNLLTNDEVLAVNQDAKGKQADKIFDKDGIQYWKKETASGYATGIFNLNETAQTVTVQWSDLGISGVWKVRDLWRQTDMGEMQDSFTVSVPAHGVVLAGMRKI